ncbi:hypothetical protein AYI69_g5276 [Smittium culicis]|uniref:Uncharacterized protein n=1 Tax=Smittium culicis TaxID=133412 RepID=A0A1R1Y716_9FUNG|nr:hypothetical protein AYI69_g5276 [Smittium culicis]
MVANVGKLAAMERIRDELGITSVFMRTSTARERAYHKWPTSKTWIADLIKAPIKARMATWSTGKDEITGLSSTGGPKNWTLEKCVWAHFGLPCACRT